MFVRYHSKPIKKLCISWLGSVDREQETEHDSSSELQINPGYGGCRRLQTVLPSTDDSEPRLLMAHRDSNQSNKAEAHNRPKDCVLEQFESMRTKTPGEFGRKFGRANHTSVSAEIESDSNTNDAKMKMNVNHQGQSRTNKARALEGLDFWLSRKGAATIFLFTGVGTLVILLGQTRPVG